MYIYIIISSNKKHGIAIIKSWVQQNPAAGSPTATLLRLHRSRRFHLPKRLYKKLSKEIKLSCLIVIRAIFYSLLS
jgi:hypothetical protein